MPPLPELFTPTYSRPSVMKYRRFEAADAALCFAIEKLPSSMLVGTILEVNEGRFGCREIRELYDSRPPDETG